MVRFDWKNCLVIDPNQVGLQFNSMTSWDYDDRIYDFGNLIPWIYGSYSGFNFADLTWESIFEGEFNAKYVDHNNNPINTGESLVSYVSFSDNCSIQMEDLGGGRFRVKLNGTCTVSGRCNPCFVIGEMRLRCQLYTEPFMLIDENFKVGIGVSIGGTQPGQYVLANWNVI